MSIAWPTGCCTATAGARGPSIWRRRWLSWGRSSSTVPAVAVILKGYPRLSETFIAQEIRELERLGADLRIISLRHPTDRHRHPVHREIAAPVRYLPEYLHHEPLRVLRGLAAVRRKAGFAKALSVWLRDLRRDPTRNRIRRFGQACVLAAELEPDTTHLHAHFLHTPASVARYAAAICGLPWSCSAHAKDIWTTSDWEIAEKLASLDWLVTCTAAGRDRLQDLARDPDRVALVYHGVDLARFPPGGDDRPARDGNLVSDPVTILSVGRMVEKKGYDDLLDALAGLPPAMSWRLRHIGGGKLGDRLRARAARLGIEDRISWLGPQPQETVLDEMRAADLFVLASRVASDGDRDGLPNVLMEAQSQGLAVLATRVSAIPELIIDQSTGFLVRPGDPDALAQALARLIADPELRRRLGRAGAKRVRDSFSLAANIGEIARRFGMTREERWAAACE
ncbi:MAG: glycosyltransferase [Rhodospirillales bacterium]|nr:MAG: glycosyltransferase [Rhodospirillales bacterium]